MATFNERTRFLESQVGQGNLIIKIVVSQPYAADVHVDRHERHPKGGISEYVRVPLFNKLDNYLRRIARSAIVESGSQLEDAFRYVALDMIQLVYHNAPRLTHVLRNSTNVFVSDNGRVTMSRRQRASYRWDKE